MAGHGLFCGGCVCFQELLLVLECWINHWRVMSAERDRCDISRVTERQTERECVERNSEREENTNTSVCTLILDIYLDMWQKALK